MLKPTDVIGLSPVKDAHVAFVFDSWRGSGLSRMALKHVLVSPESRSVVAHVLGYPDDFVGWACSFRNSLVYVYVRGHLRKNGFGSLLIAATVPDSVPIQCAVWTPMARKLALHGFPLQFDSKMHATLERMR